MKLLRSKLFLFTAALVIAACIIMFAAFAGSGNTVLGRLTGAVVTPIENGLSHVSSWAKDLFGYFYRYSALLEENERLHAEISEYQKLEVEYYAAVSENEELRRLSRLLERHSDFESELCSVISYDGTSFQSSFTINRGSSSGIKVDDPVVVEEGLVGYVSEVGPNYANVITLLNHNSKVGAMVSRTREVVVAEGDMQVSALGLIKLSYLRNDTDIREGDWIVTTGSGGIYPKGLIIGRVVEKELESHGISSYATIRPVVDLENLTGVFVIKSFDVSD